MTLSIVVPVLDDARHLAALLPALPRECPDAEIIVVDGGSQDGSPAVARRTAGVRLLTARRGRAPQMNAGAAASRGDVLLFLHADTRLPAGAGAAIEAALRDPRVVYGRFDVRFDSGRWPFRVIASLMNLRSRLTGICTGDQAIFVRRAAFAAVGGYPDIPLMEDVALTRTLKRRGRRAALRLRVTTAARKWEREGIARTVGLMWTLRLLHAARVPPERLHDWYYGPGPAPARDPGAGEEGIAPG
ncbi:MAG TPA: TIGR04283 family arsenosugar biosynthesis glycosyltransferase [Methylomirabilota bacterium]|nr:TIGR04283 family arsenosugar biosynthesis glycosyltransferase [Methylomirabilota bacterium]